MGWPRTVLVLTARTVIGLLLASVLSVIGIGVAWGLFVFFGAAAHATLLILFAAGSGIGAGVGGFIAWLQFDRVPSWQVHLGTVLVMALALFWAVSVGMWDVANKATPGEKNRRKSDPANYCAA